MKKNYETFFRKGLTRGSGMFLILFFVICSGFLTEAEKKYNLIFAVYDEQAAQNHLVHIREVSFINGGSGSVDNVMDVVTQKDGDNVPKIRFDLGPNTIYRNRWIITAYGNVIDMEAKKVLVDTHDQFVKASGDSIVFYTNDIFRGIFFSVLNLKTGVYAEVKSLSYNALTGNTQVQPDCSSKNYKIYYYPPSAAKIELVKDAGYGEDISLIQGGKPCCPIYWIDNDNFLYPNYSSTHDYVSIMKVSLSSHAQEKIGDIDQLPENHSLSKFYKNADGQIVYECARGKFGIDLSKKKVSELLFLPAGNGFSIGVNEIDKKGRAIQNNNQTIGTYFCDPELAATTKGYIAFPYEIVLGDEHYLQGIQIYSTTTSKWKSIGDSDLSAIIGWTEE